MATKEQALKKIQNWIVTCTGLQNNKVIFAYQNLSLPELPYIEITVTDEKKRSNEDERVSNNDGTITFTQIRELYLTVHAYGKDSLDLLKKVSDKNTTVAAIREFYGDIAINRVSDPVDRPLLENNKWIGHAYIEIFLQYEKKITENIGYFNKVPNFILNCSN